MVILGGGLAGLCLAIQLKRGSQELDVLVLERRSEPAPDAAFKVGESSVEIGSQYFTEVLGLRDLLDEELPKFGLRFFFSHGDNRDIAERFELGPSRFLHVPSFQIDRGHFENALVSRARELGAEVRFGQPVRHIELGREGARHEATLADGARVGGRFLVDASGRASLLKRRLGLRESNGHDVNASWLRVDHALDLDTWSDDGAFSERVDEPRHLSTNHLMGEGYWVWLIPLRGGRTSVGIVVDDAVHGFDAIRTPDRARAWLARHEPQLALKLPDSLEDGMDFRTLRGYSHGCEQIFGPDRWFITGEAGVFSDPLYSPGSDFIGIANSMIADLILRDHAGEDVTERAQSHERTFASLHRTVMTIYRGQYPLMGSSRVMALKIVWDFTMYWAGLAPLARNDKLHDPDFMARSQDGLLELAGLGLRMQRFLRRWNESADDLGEPPARFFDYATVPFLRQLNRELLEPVDDETLLARQARNRELVLDLDREIRAWGAATVPSLARHARDAGPPHRGRLAELFDALGFALPVPTAAAPPG